MGVVGEMLTDPTDRPAAPEVIAGLETLVAQRLGLASVGGAGDTGFAMDAAPADEDLAALLKALHALYGSSIKAVLLYGSYTRGARDSLVDLYVLLDGYPSVVPRWQALANKLLPPNVYQLEADNGVRCKYALLPLRQFVRRLDRDFHSYFWARFAQPCTLVYLSDAVSGTTLVGGIASGVRRFCVETARAVPAPVRPQAFWEEGLIRTYSCELRAESGSRARTLVAANEDYLVALVRSWSAETQTEAVTATAGSEVDSDAGADGVILYPSYPGGWRWSVRRVVGKFLSVARLLKAAFTFNDGFAYLLWKIERHSGVYVEPTALQRRLPLLLGWPVFWRLYQLGAFR